MKTLNHFQDAFLTKTRATTNLLNLLYANKSYLHLYVTGPQCIAPGFPVEDEKFLMPGMILSDGEKNDAKHHKRTRVFVHIMTSTSPTQLLDTRPILYLTFHTAYFISSMSYCLFYTQHFIRAMLYWHFIRPILLLHFILKENSHSALSFL